MPQDSDSPPAGASLPTRLDAIDRHLIALLQANARESTANLARKLGIARTTVVARLRRLESGGVIVGYTVRLGEANPGAMVQAYVGLTVNPKAGRDVVRSLARLPEVQQVASVSGNVDYLLLVQAETTARLDQLLDEIGELDGVGKTDSLIVLAMRIDRKA